MICNTNKMARRWARSSASIWLLCGLWLATVVVLVQSGPTLQPAEPGGSPAAEQSASGETGNSAPSSQQQQQLSSGASQLQQPLRLPKINIYINKNEIRKLLGKSFN